MVAAAAARPAAEGCASVMKEAGAAAAGTCWKSSPRPRQRRGVRPGQPAALPGSRLRIRGRRELVQPSRIDGLARRFAHRPGCCCRGPGVRGARLPRLGAARGSALPRSSASVDPPRPAGLDEWLARSAHFRPGLPVYEQVDLRGLPPALAKLEMQYALQRRRDDETVKVRPRESPRRRRVPAGRAAGIAAWSGPGRHRGARRAPGTLLLRPPGPGGPC